MVLQSRLVLGAVFRIRWIFLLLCLTATSFYVVAGDSIPSRSITVSLPQYGFIVPHTKQMTHLIRGHSYGFHISALKQLNTKPWHAAYNFPSHGIDFSYLNTGNREQLGEQYSLSYLLNLPLHKKDIEGLESTHHFHHYIGLGLGVGYSTRIWDLRDNHQAPVLGSHINAALIVQYSARILQTKSGSIRSGLRITHFSNGAFQMPNLGTNALGLFASYNFENNSSQDFPKLPKYEYRPLYRFTLFAGAGAKEIQPPTGKKYPALTLSALAEKRISVKSSLGIGADLFYNEGVKAYQEQVTDGSVSNSDVVQAGLLASLTMHFGRFEFKMQQGYYLRDKFRINTAFYNRFGLRYTLSTHWFTQLTLKTHFAKADHGELGIGYSF